MDNLSVWRWLAIGLGVAALVFAGGVLTLMRQARKDRLRQQLRASPVSTIAHPDGFLQWKSTVDMQHSSLVVTLSTHVAIAAVARRNYGSSRRPKNRGVPGSLV